MDERSADDSRQDAPGEAGAPQEGWLASEVEAELAGLRLLYDEVTVARSGSLTGTSPADVRERLLELSSRFRGARAVGLRREPVPAAYRAFFRQIGLDPDVQRTPIEAAALERMLRGGFLSTGLLEDVLLLALLDTGVPVWALDRASLNGPLGIRASREGELLGAEAGAGTQLLPEGRLVVADAEHALAPLFGEAAPGYAPGARARELTLFALGVAGVPALYLEESLFSARAALESA